MERWQNKVAVVTGSSSGIGAACSKYLVERGMIVVGLARRLERLEEIKSNLSEEQKSRFYPVRCDVSKEEDIVKTFAWVESKLGGVDILINNAVVIRPTELIRENNSADIRAVIDTNITGVIFCTREAFQSMKKRSVDGHVIIINSIVGHSVPFIPGYSFNVYAPSKHAITAMTEVLRQEFLIHQTKIKVTSISPGGVDTEIIPEEFSAIPMLRSEDIADAVVYCIQTPPNVQIHEMIIKPIGEQFS